MKNQINEYQENQELNQVYNWMEKETSALFPFQTEILETIRGNTDLDDNSAILDMGCGRGMFLNFLADNGYKNIKGMEPSQHFRNKSFTKFDIYDGTFEKNSFADNSFDLVCAIHTLHHLPHKHPVYAVKEMLRISRKYILLVEVNNTNLPIFFRALVTLSMEINCYLYNLNKVRKLVTASAAEMIISKYMQSSFLSGNSKLYHLLSYCGTRPYNITLAKKTGK